MKPQAKRHHYLPESYLAGFTSDGTSEGRLVVVDKTKGSNFSTKPVNVGVETYFNRIEYDGEQSDILEERIARVEGILAPALHRLIQSESFPSSEDLNKILNLIAVIRAHNPRVREENKNYWEGKARATGKRIVEAREGIVDWENLSLDSGEPISEEAIAMFRKISTKKIKDKKYSLEILKNSVVREEFDDMDRLLHLLRERCWTVLLAPKDKPGFLCSDDPVSLIGSSDDRSLISYREKNAEVLFPINPHIALLGVYNAPKSPVQSCDAELVGSVNFGLISRAARFFYSKDKTATIRWREESEIVPLTEG